MINKVTSSNNSPNFGFSTGAGKKFATKIMKSEGFGKVLEVAAENQNVCQAGFALGICCAMRPASNYLVTKDKKDAGYASAHSVSSGLIGFVWPLVLATPLAVGIKRVLAKPQKYLRPEVVKKFYPNVAMQDVLSKDGKKIGKKIKVNADGDMLREDGSVLQKDLEPLMIYKHAERKPFEEAHPNLYVDESGVVRSKEVFKTEKGALKLDEKGNKVGVAVQKDLTPITEEMEIGAQKEKNVQTMLNMSADILLAPIRASLTIALIPSILNVFGITKSGSEPIIAKKDGSPIVSKPAISTISSSNLKGAHIAQSFDSFKKGGV